MKDCVRSSKRQKKIRLSTKFRSPTLMEWFWCRPTKACRALEGFRTRLPLQQCKPTIRRGTRSAECRPAAKRDRPKLADFWDDCPACSRGVDLTCSNCEQSDAGAAAGHRRAVGPHLSRPIRRAFSGGQELWRERR